MNKIINFSKLKKISGIKNKIILTSGCFDIFHAGHASYLREAKEKIEGTLVVAVNSDKSIKEIKGKNRPINNLKSRLTVLNSIEYIDYIIVFDEKTPEKVLLKLKPNIFFKGGDYKNSKNNNFFKKLKKNNCKLILLSQYKNLSSTKILKKINTK